uniref:Protein argonaute 4A-like n=1 Tax=Tanacetum cinerariifolium TaxID=118510 RepID=A0A6L2KGL2_TANCI|nr:protein argonaute 4A-like [Tanacetum cinerariifolium]
MSSISPLLPIMVCGVGDRLVALVSLSGLFCFVGVQICWEFVSFQKLAQHLVFSALVTYPDIALNLKDFLTRYVLFRCDSSGDLYPVTPPSPTPHDLLSVSLTQNPQPQTHPMITRSQVGTFKPNHRFHGHTSHISPLPKSLSVALSDPYWRDAMYDEYNALIKNGTWILVSKPPNVNVVRSMWLFRHKYHVDGSLSKYKARLVANGRNQQYGVDCNDTFSPVVKPTTIRTVLSLALARNWRVHQLDVKNAFLDGDLTETVYMYQPSGFVDSRFPHYVCRLQRSLYGLKQAPRAWFQPFAGYALRVGFTSSQCDSSLFIYQHGTEALKQSNYNADPLITSTGITISTSFTEVQGRVLDPPKLKFGNGADLLPRGGRWNFNNKTLIEPTQVSCWAIVNFSARCDCNSLRRDLLRCSQAKGMRVQDPHSVIEENQQARRNPAPIRVDMMFEAIKRTLPGPPYFLLCILPERKNSDIYGPWKRKCLVDFGIITQCIAPTRINDQYLTNLLLKINAKTGGINSLLSVECSNSIPLVSKVPTIIFGMDVSHGSPGRSDVPSIAAVVSSRKWPLISQYRASVRGQSARVEMIDGLFKPVSPHKDEGMIRELLTDFYTSTTRQLKPQHIIIFRDGVSESQFNQVLNIELEQIMQACKFLDENWEPKFMVIVAQKTHHTKFFQPNSDANVSPGTIIDNTVCHPKNNDFYLCAQNGPIGTTRPTHYHVLLDQIGFTTDDLQELVHSLSYVYQRSTTAISVVAPICYAHLAAAQMSLSGHVCMWGLVHVSGIIIIRHLVSDTYANMSPQCCVIGQGLVVAIRSCLYVGSGACLWHYYRPTLSVRHIREHVPPVLYHRLRTGGTTLDKNMKCIRPSERGWALPE